MSDVMASNLTLSTLRNFIKEHFKGRKDDDALFAFRTREFGEETGLGALGNSRRRKA
jgi:hypothetical protein